MTALGAWDVLPSSHHCPDVRHGPAAISTRPPAMPRRSVATRTGLPCSMMTRAGMGNRNRRKAIAGDVVVLCPAGAEMIGVAARVVVSGANGVTTHAPGRQLSTTAGAPQRPSPI